MISTSSLYNRIVNASYHHQIKRYLSSLLIENGHERFSNVQNYQKYPHSFPVTMSIPEYIEQYNHLPSKYRGVDEEIHLAGRITSIRSASKKLYFIDIQRDGATTQVLSELKHYKICNSMNETSNEIEFQNIHASLRRGDVVGIRGFPGKSGKGELSIIPREIKILSPCLPPLPNSKFGLKDNDIRFRQRYLDLLVNPSNISIFKTRSKIIQYIRNFLQDRSFIDVETPILAAEAGGASARPFKTHYNALGTDFCLRIAPELFLKQLVIGGMDRVFEIGKVFRNEGIDASHNPEFTVCEFYQAYADYNDLMKTTEDLLHGLVQEMTNGKSYLVLSENETSSKEMKISFQPPYRRISIVETLEKELNEKLPDLSKEDAIEKLLNLCKKNNIECPEPHTTSRLLDRLIGEYLEPLCINPTFLIDHPLCLSPLAKSHRSKIGQTERFELFVNGKELCNAYTELNDPMEQRRRFNDQMKDKKKGDIEAQTPDEEFCTALEYGLPPTGGFGIGIDRLVMLLTNQKHIREVILFPSVKPKDSNQKMELDE